MHDHSEGRLRCCLAGEAGQDHDAYQHKDQEFSHRLPLPVIQALAARSWAAKARTKQVHSGVSRADVYRWRYFFSAARTASSASTEVCTFCGLRPPKAAFTSARESARASST